ncbi:MAG: 3-hydroxyisobutyrate dehydrogenase [Alphaproteobacteria bacterium]|nr:MAG: 3-hydroxyisobutyrate dehydrogenase [Alphaproteobacteria bacterium]
MTRIGFIGLGNMGGPMAANLVKAGLAVTAFDLSKQALARAADAGAKPAADMADAVAGADAVVTMLPASKHVRLAYLDSHGILAKARKGALLVDCSTIDVETARAVADAAAKAGFDMVDAPVSGGTAGAAAATLTFMVGGPAAAFARARPILAHMGKTVIHAGDAGAGQAAKICNNMMLGIQMLSVCEAFVLAEKLGLDAQKLYDISSTSSGQCWSLTSYCPVPGPVPGAPSNRDYRPGFAAAMMLKDLRLAQDAAQACQAATPMGAAAAQLYGEMIEKGQGDLDFSGIIKMLRREF